MVYVICTIFRGLFPCSLNAANLPSLPNISSSCHERQDFVTLHHSMRVPTEAEKASEVHGARFECLQLCIAWQIVGNQIFTLLREHIQFWSSFWIAKKQPSGHTLPLERPSSSAPPPPPPNNPPKGPPPQPFRFAIAEDDNAWHTRSGAHHRPEDP